MGIHGSPTCVMQFDGAKGWLVGEPHKGMAAMFTMMNNARLGVGVQGIGVGERAYQHALAYAMDRVQGKAEGSGTIVEHADVRRMLMTMLNSIINDGIMADDFPLAPGEGYLSPPSGDVASYVEGIERLPLNPHPNVFGLHENADISCAQDETEVA